MNAIKISYLCLWEGKVDRLPFSINQNITVRDVILTVLCLVIPFSLSSQEADSTTTLSQPQAVADTASGPTDFTYSTDRIFHDPADLIGYTFVPDKYLHAGRPMPLNPGDMAIEFGAKELTIKGVDGLDTYYIPDIQRMHYGFRVHLVDNERPSVPMVMFIKADENGIVDQLSFPTLNHGTHGFSIPQRPLEEQEALDELFSNVDDFVVKKLDTLYDQEWIPWLMVPDIAIGPQVEQLDGATKIIFEIEEEEPKKKKGKEEEDEGADDQPEGEEEEEQVIKKVFLKLEGTENAGRWELKQLKYLAHGSPHTLTTTYTISGVLKPEKGKGKSSLYIQLDPEFHIVEISVGRSRFYPRP